MQEAFLSAGLHLLFLFSLLLHIIQAPSQIEMHVLFKQQIFNDSLTCPFIYTFLQIFIEHISVSVLGTENALGNDTDVAYPRELTSQQRRVVLKIHTLLYSQNHKYQKRERVVVSRYIYIEVPVPDKYCASCISYVNYFYLHNKCIHC